MQTKIADDLTHPAHMDGAVTHLDGLDPTEYGLDAIAFVAHVHPRGLAAMRTVADNRTLTVEQIRTLFDATPEATALAHSDGDDQSRPYERFRTPLAPRDRGSAHRWQRPASCLHNRLHLLTRSRTPLALPQRVPLPRDPALAFLGSVRQETGANLT